MNKIILICFAIITAGCADGLAPMEVLAGAYISDTGVKCLGVRQGDCENFAKVANVLLAEKKWTCNRVTTVFASKTRGARTIRIECDEEWKYQFYNVGTGWGLAAGW